MVDRDEDFSAYVAARSVTLLRSAVLLGCSLQDAEDLVQTTLMRCYPKWSRIRRARDVDAYVYRAMFNSNATRLRRRWRGELPYSEVPELALSDGLEETAMALAVRAALSGLDSPHRCVLVLKYFADLTDKQVAFVLGVPVGTVKSRVSRAVDRLAADAALANLLEDRRS